MQIARMMYACPKEREREKERNLHHESFLGSKILKKETADKNVLLALITLIFILKKYFQHT